MVTSNDGHMLGADINGLLEWFDTDYLKFVHGAHMNNDLNKLRKEIRYIFYEGPQMYSKTHYKNVRDENYITVKTIKNAEIIPFCSVLSANLVGWYTRGEPIYFNELDIYVFRYGIRAFSVNVPYTFKKGMLHSFRSWIITLQGAYSHYFYGPPSLIPGFAYGREYAMISCDWAPSIKTRYKRLPNSILRADYSGAEDLTYQLTMTKMIGSPKIIMEMLSPDAAINAEDYDEQTDAYKRSISSDITTISSVMPDYVVSNILQCGPGEVCNYNIFELHTFATCRANVRDLEWIDEYLKHDGVNDLLISYGGTVVKKVNEYDTMKAIPRRATLSPMSRYVCFPLVQDSFHSILNPESTWLYDKFVFPASEARARREIANEDLRRLGKPQILDNMEAEVVMFDPHEPGVDRTKKHDEKHRTSRNLLSTQTAHALTRDMAPDETFDGSIEKASLPTDNQPKRSSSLADNGNGSVPLLERALPKRSSSLTEISSGHVSLIASMAKLVDNKFPLKTLKQLVIEIKYTGEQAGKWSMIDYNDWNTIVLPAVTNDSAKQFIDFLKTVPVVNVVDHRRSIRVGDTDEAQNPRLKLLGGEKRISNIWIIALAVALVAIIIICIVCKVINKKPDTTKHDTETTDIVK